MVDFLKRWYNRYFGQEEAVVVFVVFVLAMLIVWALGSILIPVFAALIISYLCIPAIEWIKRRKIPELIAVVIVFSACLLVVLLTALYLLPMVWQQFKELMNNLPDIGQQVQAQLLLLAASYPEYIEQAAVEAWVNDLGLNQLNSVKEWLPKVVTFSIATLPNLLNAMIYLVIVPILVFFMLKDRTLLWEKFLRFWECPSVQFFMALMMPSAKPPIMRILPMARTMSSGLIIFGIT